METKFAIKKVCSAGAAVICLSLLAGAAQAADTFNLSGTVEIGLDFANFEQLPTTGPFVSAPGYGAFQVTTPVTGIFAADGVAAGTTTGKIQSLNEGPGAVTLSSAFLTFDNAGSKLQLWATDIAAGNFGMFTITDQPGGSATLAFDVSGYVFDTSTNTKVDNFQLLATAQFAGETAAQFESNLPLGTTFSATVTTSPLSSGVPEPSAWALMLAGIGATGLSLRLARRKRRVAVLTA